MLKMKNGNKMKLIKIVVLSLALIFGCDNTSNINNVVKENLNGNVKSTRKLFFNAVQYYGAIVKDSLIFEDYIIYNKQGYLVEENNWDKVERISGRKIYNYDTNGNIFEEKYYVSGEKLDKRWIYKYDNNGNKIEEWKDSSNGSIYDRKIYQYDNIGNIIEVIEYSLEGSIENRTAKKYNINNNIIEEKTWYTEDGQTGSKVTYKYDDYNNMIEDNAITYLNGEKWMNRISKYEYDPRGNKIKAMHYLNDKIMNSNTLEYDDYNNEIETKNYNAEGDVTLFLVNQYEYDVQKNWIKKTLINNNNPVYVVERKIEYYD